MIENSIVFFAVFLHRLVQKVCKLCHELVIVWIELDTVSHIVVVLAGKTMLRYQKLENEGEASNNVAVYISIMKANSEILFNHRRKGEQ
jgi:hypothetical protein